MMGLHPSYACYANIIIPFDEQNGVAVDILIAKIGAILQERMGAAR